MSGVLALMLGLGGKLVQLIDKSIIVNTVGPTDAIGTFTLNTSGGESATNAASNPWLLAGSSSSYECMATVQSQDLGITLSGSAVSTWLPLSVTQAWSYRRHNVGEVFATLLIQIRPVGGSPIASCTANYDCIVN